MLHKEDEDDKHQAPLLLRRDPTLLSPPYSPHRRPLVHLNEEEESVSIGVSQLGTEMCNLMN